MGYDYDRAIQELNVLQSAYNNDNGLTAIMTVMMKKISVMMKLLKRVILTVLSGIIFN